VSLEGPFDRFGAGGLVRAREQEVGIVALLDRTAAEERHARGPGGTVVVPAFGPELGAERDQLAHVGDGLDRAGGGKTDQAVRVEVVAEQEDRVVVARCEQPGAPVVDEVALVDRLDGEREPLLRKRREDRLPVARAVGTERVPQE
jgi:hypothetical protein